MKTHLGKTKVTMVSMTEEECKLSIKCEDIEDVKKLEYLAIISADGMCDEEIEQQVGVTAKVVGAMRK